MVVSRAASKGNGRTLAVPKFCAAAAEFHGDLDSVFDGSGDCLEWHTIGMKRGISATGLLQKLDGARLDLAVRMEFKFVVDQHGGRVVVRLSEKLEDDEEISVFLDRSC